MSDYGPDLLPQHADLLRASAVSLEVASARGYRSVIRKADLEELGFSVKQRRVPALLIPIHDVRGEITLYQIRPDEPRRDRSGKALKYETPTGARMVLDVPPIARTWLDDPEKPLLITEGTRKADAAVSKGLCCISILGVWNWRGRNKKGGTTALADWEHISIKGRKVYIAYDSDVMEKIAVHAALARLGTLLGSRGAQVRYVYLPPGEGGVKVGLDDYLAEGHSVEDLFALASSKLREPNTYEDEPTVIRALLGLASSAELFRSQDDEAFATVEVKTASSSNFQTHSIQSPGFRRWLRREFYVAYKSSPDGKLLKEAIETFEAKALFDGEIIPVYRRVARVDESIYIDLCNPAWEIVKTTAKGWEIVTSSDAPMRFHRKRNMEALPRPVAGGSIKRLRTFLNLPKGESAWRLIVSWLVSVLTGTAPYVVLVLLGEQGNGKSGCASVLRALTDPNKVPLRSPPESLRDLMVCASQSGMVVLDNLSRLPQWLSDGLCCLACGGGIAGRQLYTDSEEAAITATVPTIITAIEDVVRSSDLVDRAVFLELPQIPEEGRREEQELWDQLRREGPQLFGALLDAVVVTLKERPGVVLDSAPRMADFARLGVAVERALQWPQGSFLDAYRGNRSEAATLPLEVSLLGPNLVTFAEGGGCEAITWAELLTKLDMIAGEKVTKNRDWPKTPRALSGAVRRLTPNLRSVGIEVEWGRKNKRRWVTLRPSPNEQEYRHHRHSSDQNDQKSRTYLGSEGDGGADEDRHHQHIDRHPDRGDDGKGPLGDGTAASAIARISREGDDGDGGDGSAGQYEEGVL